MDTQVLKAAVESIMPGFPEISLVYLFGSQVSGNTGPMSDIDLGIFTEGVQDEFTYLAHFTHKLNKALETNLLDVIPLRRAPIELAYAVIAKGICIYQKDLARRVEFEANVLSRYGDYLPVLRAQREAILRGEDDEIRVQRYREVFRRTERTLREIKDTGK